MTELLSESIISAIAIECRRFGFYRSVEAKVSDIKIRKVFECFAKEVALYLKSFCDLYQGNDDDLIEILNRNNIYVDPFYFILLSSIGSDSAEIDSLRIALKEEQTCIEWYSVFVETIRVPHVRDTFAHVLGESQRHCEIILEEYANQLKRDSVAVRSVRPRRKYGNIQRNTHCNLGSVHNNLHH